MPKLDGIEEKYWNGYKVDKENDTTIYSDEKHVYFDKIDGRPFVSATSLIHLYTNEFDEDFWATYKALEEILDMTLWLPVKKTLLATKKFNPKLITKLNIDENLFLQKCNEIKAEYQRKREESCERGTKIHALFENSFYGKTEFDFSKFGYADLKGNFTCNKDYYRLDLERGVYPEFLISVTSRDGILKVSGQIDLLIVDGLDITIIDWKTNQKIDKQSFYDKNRKSNVMMKHPLNNLQDCNFNHYQLQLSLYAYMLQQINPLYNIKHLKIVHIDHDGQQHEYECEYLKDDVERMLKHYKKQLRIKQALNELKPVIE